MLFIFDKGLESEKRINLDYYSEQVRNRKLISNKDYKIEKQSDFPDVSQFKEDTLFSSLEVTDGDIEVPVIGSYNHIDTFNTSYIVSTKTYQVNIVLGWKE